MESKLMTMILICWIGVVLCFGFLTYLVVDYCFDVKEIHSEQETLILYEKGNDDLIRLGTIKKIIWHNDGVANIQLDNGWVIVDFNEYKDTGVCPYRILPDPNTVFPFYDGEKN